MPRTADTGGADHLKADTVLGDFDAAHAAQGLTDQIIPQNQRFQTEPQQGRVHACGLVDHVQAGHARHHIRHRLFPPRLHIGQLGIGNARRSAAGQVIVTVHLRATRRQQRLFAGPARHGTGAQVADKGPRAKNRGMPRLDGVNIDQPRQTFRNRLYDRTGNRGRGGCTGLTG